MRKCIAVDCLTSGFVFPFQTPTSKHFSLVRRPSLRPSFWCLLWELEVHDVAAGVFLCLNKPTCPCPLLLLASFSHSHWPHLHQAGRDSTASGRWAWFLLGHRELWAHSPAPQPASLCLLLGVPSTYPPTEWDGETNEKRVGNNEVMRTAPNVLDTLKRGVWSRH